MECVQLTGLSPNFIKRARYLAHNTFKILLTKSFFLPSNTLLLTKKIQRTIWGFNSKSPDWGKIASYQLFSTFFPCHRNCPKMHCQWRGRGCTGQLTARIKWRGVDFNTNFELRPDSGIIHFSVSDPLFISACLYFSVFMSYGASPSIYM